MTCLHCGIQSGESVCRYCAESLKRCAEEVANIDKRSSSERQKAYEANHMRIAMRKQFITAGLDESVPYRFPESILVRVHDAYRKVYNLTPDTLFTVTSYGVDGVLMTTESQPFFSMRISLEDVVTIKKVMAEHRYCSKCHAYLELSDDNFYRYANGNFLARCKDCIKDERKDTYKQGKVHRFNRKVGG